MCELIEKVSVFPFFLRDNLFYVSYCYSDCSFFFLFVYLLFLLLRSNNLQDSFLFRERKLKKRKLQIEIFHLIFSNVKKIQRDLSPWPRTFFFCFSTIYVAADAVKQIHHKSFVSERKNWIESCVGRLKPKVD